MKYTFTPSPPIEWFTVEESCQIFGLTPQRISELIQDGELKARSGADGEPRISSTSLDKYTEGQPPQIAPPKPPTYVKIWGKAYEELSDGRLRPL